MAVYILHFEEKIGHGRRGQAQHYVGYTEHIERRLREHLLCHSSGSPLVKAAISLGISIRLADYFYEADRKFERKIKRCKNTRRFCPICQAQKRQLKLALE